MTSTMTASRHFTFVLLFLAALCALPTPGFAPSPAFSAQSRHLKPWHHRRATSPRSTATHHTHGDSETEYAHSTDVAIVGCGVGALSCALQAAADGHQVIVLEKNSREEGAGGRMGSFTIHADVTHLGDAHRHSHNASFRFDRGPSLMLLPDVYGEAFDAHPATQRIWREAIKPRIARVNDNGANLYSLFFEDSKSPVRLRGCGRTGGDGGEGLRHDAEEFERLEPGGGEAFARLMVQSEVMLKGGLANFIEGRFKPDTLVPMAQEALFGGAWPLSSQESSLKSRFSSSHARAALSFQSLYIGLDPWRAPAVFNLLQPLEYGPYVEGGDDEGGDSELVQPPRESTSSGGRVQGVFYPRGGFTVISEGLVEACLKLGVQFMWDTEVESLTISDGDGDGDADSTTRVSGVRLVNGREIKSRATIVNGDVPFAERSLIPSDKHRRNFDGWAMSSSVVSIHWALDKQFSQLSHHNIFLAVDDAASGTDERRRQAWDWERSAWANTNHPPAQELDGIAKDTPINFYVHAPARTDASACPPGCDAITVLVPAPLLRPGATAKHKAIQERNARALVIDRFTRAGMDVTRHILAETILSAPDWERKFHLEGGAVFGFSHPLSQLSVFRPGATHPSLSDLYFCGASARPGNGVPLVLMGAKGVYKKMKAVSLKAQESLSGGPVHDEQP